MAIIKKYISVILLLLHMCGCAQQRMERLESRDELEQYEQEQLHKIFSEIHTSPVFQLSIRTERTEYYQGEPINIVVSLKNRSTEYINILKEDISSAWGTTLAVLISDEEYYIRMGGGIGLNYGIPEDYCGFTIAPGDSVVTILYTVYIGRLGEDLSTESRITFANYTAPGLYTLRAMYMWPLPEENIRNCIWSESLTSNDIAITIKATEGEDFGALELFLQGRWYNNAEPTLSRREHDQREIEKSEYYSRILREYPNTVFAKYSKYYIALFQLNHDSNLAMKYFEELLVLDPNFRSQEIHCALLDCYEKLGMYEKYESIIDNFVFDKSLYNVGIFHSF